MAFLEALTLGLIALILAPGYFFYFDITPKTVVLLVGTAGLLILAVRRRDLSGGPQLFGMLLLLNAGSLALSTAFSVNRSLSLYGSTWRSFGAAIQSVAMLLAWLVAWHCAGRPDRARVILRAVSVAGIISAAYGIAQYFGWDPLLSKSTYTIGEGVWSIVRPPGTLGYASYFATWLLLTVFLSLALAKMEAGRFWKAVAWSATTLALFAMLLTGTRAAVLGLIAGGVVWLWWSGFRLPRRAVIAAGVLVLCGAGFYYSPAGQKMRSRSRWFVEDPWGGARPLLWRDSLSMALKHPVLGFGPEVFLGQFPLFESRKLAEEFPDFVHESPHNIFLDALVSQGMLGLLILCGLCAAGFAAARKLKKLKSPMGAWLAAALAAGIVSQQFTAFTMPTAVLFLTVIALAAAAATEAGAPQPNIVLSGAAPLLVLAMLCLGVRITLAERALEATRLLLDAGNLRATTKQYEQYWYWNLPGTNANIWYSRRWMDIARRSTDAATLEQALGIATQAAVLATENAEAPFDAWYNLAQVSALREDYRTTETSLRRAVEAHPNWFKPHWMLAQELRLVSNFEEARKEAALAVELDGGHDAEVSRTLKELGERN